MTTHALTPLCELARKYGTDKGGWHTIAGETCHVYTPAYYALLGEHTQKVRSVLEIGVNQGCSLRMWRDLFPKAMIYGIDSNAASLFTEERIQCVAADQGNAASLLSAMATLGEPRFDLIVDDGSHEETHQVLSCRTLMPFLEPNGLYVIEDITFDCQPERYGDQLGYPWTAINVGVGIGKAHCYNDCPRCHGAEGERLLVVSQSMEHAQTIAVASTLFG